MDRNMKEIIKENILKLKPLVEYIESKICRINSRMLEKNYQETFWKQNRVWKEAKTDTNNLMKPTKEYAKRRGKK